MFALVALPAVPAAAADRPDLAVSVDPGSGDLFPGDQPGHRVLVDNRGTVAATGVRLTVDLRGVDARVSFKVPNFTLGCGLTDRVITCVIDTISPGTTFPLIPVIFTVPRGTVPGPAGDVVVTLAGDADNTARYALTVAVPEPEPTALVADLNTAGTRIGPGDVRPIFAAVHNNGFVPLTEYRINVLLPTGAVLVERYRDCSYTSLLPKGGGDGYAYFPTQMDCHLSRPLRPGETLPLFDPATKRTLLHVTFGRNLSGPNRHVGHFVTVPEAPPGRPDNPTGPSFAAAVDRLPILAAGPEPAGLHSDGAISDFGIWSKPNRFDIAVTAPRAEVAGPSLIRIDFALVNNGPSDSGRLEYVITAPRGTVITMAPFDDTCETVGHPGELEAESAQVRCLTRTEEFPTSHSGILRQDENFLLKVKSRVGGGGKIVVHGGGVGSTESDPRNNTVLFSAVPPTSGGGSGGGGGGLPITGAPIALVAGAGGLAAVLGLVLLLATRRRAR